MSPQNFKVTRRIQRVQELQTVERGRARIRASEAALDRDVLEKVRRARDAGASWSDIGSALGVSKQAAQQKFVASVN